ncbi:hypothetical protein, partial [Streptomyces sp. MnatMP-M17]|uniref:hypothetical protein n=1 Tax=Streptomyces sp. MnatMP-M17 TaxID=1839780 RepID=UPI001C405BC5
MSEGNGSPQESVGYPDPGVYMESGGYPDRPDAYPESGSYQEPGFDPVLDTVSLEEGLAQLLRASAADGAPA